MSADITASQRLFNLLLAVLVLLVVWQLAASWYQHHLLPTPGQVWSVAQQSWISGELQHHLLVTLKRVAISFVLAMSIGSLIGILMGLYPKVDRILDPYLILFLNIPALVLIILLYVWFGLVEVAAITAVVLNKVPNAVVTLREGARTLDPALQEMAKVFEISRWKRIRHIILPQLTPYFLVAARSGLSLIWKIVLVVELLGRSDGIGFQLHLAFQMFDIAQILAYSLAFIVVVQILEWGVMQPLERYSARWRRRSEAH